VKVLPADSVCVDVIAISLINFSEPSCGSIARPWRGCCVSVLIVTFSSYKMCICLNGKILFLVYLPALLLINTKYR
jgi:hypothetical protein